MLSKSTIPPPKPDEPSDATERKVKAFVHQARGHLPGITIATQIVSSLGERPWMAIFCLRIDRVV
jgi:hypothetical protein